MKAKYLIIFAIITALLFSMLSYTQKVAAPPSKTESTGSQSVDPNASPSPFQTPNGAPYNPNVPSPTATPTPFWNNIIGNPGGVISNPKPSGAVGSAQTINADVWKKVANNSWQYFQPDIGVDAGTGLPKAGLAWPYFTDWDLGVYIQAVLDAQNIALITKNGEWGADARLLKVLAFLDNRTLDSQKLPYWWYEVETGRERPDLQGAGQTYLNVADTGRLLVALNNLKSYNTSWAGRIDNIVKVKSNYSVMLPAISAVEGSVNVYDYLVATGFAAFWPQSVSNIPASILNSIMSAPKVNVSGVQLPLAKISCEPLLLSLFDVRNDSRVYDLTKQVYLAHQARYSTTGKYTAFSEGNTGLSMFAYEWVVLPDGRRWVVQDPYGNNAVYPDIEGNLVDVTPIVYFKVSFSFLALYKTDYARNLTIFLENANPAPVKGYNDGADENGRQVVDVGSNTNGLIISAARYGLSNL